MAGDDYPRGTDQISTQPKRKRVAAACDRCRRQKLKCDSERPCALCVRASIPCVSDAAGRKRIVQNGPHSRPPNSAPAVAQTGRNSSSRNTLSNPPVERDIPISETGDQPDEEHFPSPESRASQGRGERLNGPRLNQYPQGRSTIALSEEVFRQFSSTPITSHETGALPGGSAASPHIDRAMTVIEVIGLELPPKHVMDYLLEIYFQSVHWFMAVFHEDTFQSDYNTIISAGVKYRQHFRYLMLLLVVLSMGARYAVEQKGSLYQGIDLELLQVRLLAKVKENMDDLLDEGEIESVQICILLSSHYLYHGRPNLAFTTLGTGIKSAQAIGLHNEGSWPQLSKTTIETWRRVWLALYVFDRFASIVFGRPCSIRDDDVETAMPEGLNGTTAFHPRLSSMEGFEDGRMERVTTFSYQRYKYRLYELASPMIGNIYFHHRSSFATIAQKVQQIHEQLVAWFAGLPEELRLPVTPADDSSQHSPIEMTFRLQALALQLAYENIQILLHRPLLSHYTGEITPHDLSRGAIHKRTPDLRSGSRTPSSPTSISTLSKNQCWDSAYRTSILSQHEQLLREALGTHAASYIGIHMFTAGTILSIVALSRPLSSRAQVSKRAIARVIRMSKLFGHRTKLCAQSQRILEELVRLVLVKEMNAILQEDSHPSRRNQQHSLSRERTGHSTPVGESSSNLLVDGLQSAGSLAIGIEGVTSVPSQELMFDDAEFTSLNLYDTNSFGNVDLNEGISSMRQVIHDNSIQNNGSSSILPNSDSLPGLMSYLQPDNTSVRDNLTFDPFGGIRAPGQTWLWDINSLQFDETSFL